MGQSSSPTDADGALPRNKLLLPLDAEDGGGAGEGGSGMTIPSSHSSSLLLRIILSEEDDDDNDICPKHAVLMFFILTISYIGIHITFYMQMNK